MPRILRADSGIDCSAGNLHYVLIPRLMWSQIYDPFGNAFLSTLVAALPIAVLLGGIGLFRLPAHLAALLGLLSSFLVATLAFQMPTGMATTAALAGAAYGFLPIGWIVLNVIFLYQLTVENGSFGVLQENIASLTPDRRLQLVLIGLFRT
jgi:lactate permease